MTISKTAERQAVPVARRVNTFSYAIRNIVVEAQRVEAAGLRVRYLNVGDPNVFGFKTPPHLIRAVERAMHDGYNGYGPSPGIPAAREAVAQELTSHGFPIPADRALITAGTSEAIDLVMSALVDSGGEVLVPMPTYPLYTAVLAKIDARAKFYRLDPSRGWQPDLDHLKSLVTPATKALVVIDPNNPTGASYPASTRRELIEFSERHNLVLLADEVYGDLGYDGPVDPIGKLDPDAAIITFSSMSKAYLAPGWRTGWLGVGRTPRLDDVLAAIKKLADGRLCSTYPMQFAVAEALLGDRSHQPIFRAELRTRADITVKSLNAMPGMSCVAPIAGFYVMPQLTLPAGRTDVDYVLGLLRATGVLCVYGSGFGMPADGGFFRIVFLASPDELKEIYGLMGSYTKEFLGV